MLQDILCGKWAGQAGQWMVGRDDEDEFETSHRLDGQ